MRWSFRVAEQCGTRVQSPPRSPCFKVKELASRFEELFDAAVVKDPLEAFATIRALSDEVAQASDLAAGDRASLCFTLSSVAINLGSDVGSTDLIAWGRVLAEFVAMDDVSLSSVSVMTRPLWCPSPD